MKKICPLCKTENEEDARFCKECNEPLYDPNTNNINKEPNKINQIEEEERPLKIKMSKCPKCNASIEEGVKLCGNCKAEIVWKDGKPRLSAAYVMQKTGCALTSLGCLIPIIVFIVFIIIALVSGMF